MAIVHLLQVGLASYTVGSPFLFLWFHRSVMKETWNNDLADRVTVRLYFISNVAAMYLAYLFEEKWGCG